MASARSLNVGLRTSEVANLRPSNYLGKGRGRGTRGKHVNTPAALVGASNELNKQDNGTVKSSEVEHVELDDDPHQYSAPRAENKILDLLKTICEQRRNDTIIELSPEDERLLVDKALENIMCGEELRRLASSMYDWTLLDPATTSCVSSLCATLATFEKDGICFRSVLLIFLQKDFQTRDEWRKEQPERWLSFVCLLCDLYAVMRTASNGYLNVLVEPVYTCLDQLLRDEKASDKQIEYGIQKLKQLGKILQTNNANKMELLIEGLRGRLLGSGTTATGRLLLLEAIELYASSWKFDEDVTKAYDELRQLSQEKA